MPAEGDAGEVPVEPCIEATETTDSLFVNEAGAGLPSEPTQPEGGDVEGPELPPLPVNPEGKPIAVPLRDASTPSSYDANDPRKLTVFAARQFKDRTISAAEPEVAVHGDRVLVTWNRGASMSSDLGATFSPVSPLDYGIFSTEDYGFCCDQLARYDQQHDLWLWVLQYEFRQPGNPNSTRPNRIRLGFAHGDAAFDARRFSYIDLIPQRLGFGADAWLDRTNLSITRENMFLSINAYSGPLETAVSHGAIVVRIALDQLVAGGSVTPTCLWPAWSYQTPRGQATRIPNALFPIRGAIETMYLAANFDTTTLAVWRWPDGAASPSLHWIREPHPAGDGYVSFRGGSRGDLYTCPHSQSVDPAGSDWCAHVDYRVLSGWKTGSQLGFAWNAAQDPTIGMQYPFMWATVVDEPRVQSCQRGECVLGHPSFGYSNTAFQYASIVPNDDGELGGVALVGGGAFDLSCELLVHDQITAPDPSSDLYWDVEDGALSLDGIHPPQYSGDYLGAWPDGGGPHTWSGACMTMRGTPEVPESTVHFLRFGRLSNHPDR